MYTLVSQPQHGALIITEPSGITKKLNETHKFTQADIIYGLVNYTSDKEIGIQTVTENMTFNVTDPQNNVLSNQVIESQVGILPETCTRFKK